MEIGAFTFADVAVGPGVDAAQRIPALLEEIALADEVGLDVFGLGEHHRPGFGTPAPAVILAAAAARTNRIRLTSAVTVLSSDDPVRLFEQFTALDLASRGRAEIMAGRGALLDSFRLFGHDLGDYDALFEEKLDLLLALRAQDRVTWSGRFRPPLVDEPIVPRPVQRPLPVWLAVGGSPASVVRAGRLGLPFALGILGGQAPQFTPLIDVHRRALEHYGHEPQPVAVTLHGFVADTSQAAADIYYPADAEVLNRIFAERGIPPTNRADFTAKTGLTGAYAVGSPQAVVEKILYQHELFGHDRVLLQLGIGSVPHRELMRAIELLGTKVAPSVRAETTRLTGSPATSP
ncbi:LLM class flavin-dependent oxidoreductase [Amycolatopsis rhabdoformis]|uniref:LLM class flavin-dependent oxidoreductase n=1 Tax=Amycolatopsis rhabdoformis TaxID=1448059 RepID=A0ABZ1I4A5_9PSEU|nr:LLM class flavin-dependent oxidoreductase [Amycolatopsis rhabdoformis]WSE29242.1 LLM class flavin-dependent oxidoreductase [Amycolatopsis rhabdoformis]